MEPAGLLGLRLELARYLGRARGLRVTPDNIIITNGFTHGLDLLARVLDTGRVAIEQPSYMANWSKSRDRDWFLLFYQFRSYSHPCRTPAITCRRWRRRKGNSTCDLHVAQSSPSQH